MAQTSRPDWTAAALAALRRQVLDATAFGAVVHPAQVEAITARLDAHLRARLRHDVVSGCPRRLHPRSPMGCQNYRREQ
ncbi:DUF6374 family protein [Nocardia ignorata]|uniref:Uncharacterized protein n=1 Tax=Nocardia ignorata TaxID=145285 RepID=A0A4V3CME4_NOCIG|nr:DUF6374 family protein [Nocardia ignorata]TDP28423.1 hypothetical protein DFR75_11736 [Nocardia ignorata]